MANVQLSHPGEYLWCLTVAARCAASGRSRRAALLLLWLRVPGPGRWVAGIPVVLQLVGLWRCVVQLREALRRAAAAAGGGG